MENEGDWELEARIELAMATARDKEEAVRIRLALEQAERVKRETDEEHRRLLVEGWKKIAECPLIERDCLREACRWWDFGSEDCCIFAVARKWLASGE
jgi:hypothetical protein